MSTTTQINHTSVGRGKWKFSSIQNYCAKKGIELRQAAYVEFSINYGFDYEHLDVTNGTVKKTSNSDPLMRMLGV